MFCTSVVCITPFPQTQCHCLCWSSSPFPTPKPGLASLLLLWSPHPRSTPSSSHLQMHESYDSPYQTKFIQWKLTNNLNPFEQLHSLVTSFPPTFQPSASTTISPQHHGAGPMGPLAMHVVIQDPICNLFHTSLTLPEGVLVHDTKTDILLAQQATYSPSLLLTTNSAGYSHHLLPYVLCTPLLCWSSSPD